MHRNCRHNFLGVRTENKKQIMGILSTFNQTASDFLRDFQSVYPDDRNLALAKKFVDTCVQINESSPVPMITFIGSKTTDLSTINRTVFEIDIQDLYTGLNDDNKKVIDEYFNNMAFLVDKASENELEMAQRLTTLKQTESFQQIEDMVKNPEKILIAMNNPNQLTAMIESVLSHKDFEGLADNLKDIQMDPAMLGTLTKLAGGGEGLAALMNNKPQ